MFASLLVKFFSYLDIQEKEIAKYESTTRFSIITKKPVSQLKKLPVSVITEIAATFGESIELSIGFENAKPLVDIKPDSPNVDIENDLLKIQSLSDTTDLRLHIQIQKDIFLREFGLPSEGCNGILYFFESNLEKLLSSSLASLDEVLFPDKDRPTVVLLTDTNVLCTGMLLAIVGGEYTKQLKKYIPRPSRRVIQRVEYFQHTREEYLNWVGFQLQNITPVHLICDFSGEVDALEKILTNRLLDLFVVYSANRSIVEKSRIRAVYASSEQTMELSTSETDLTIPKRDDIIRLITWIETSNKEDKLIIFQNTVAREITGDDQDQNYKDFIDRLSHLLREARWNYRVYLDNKITKHFEKTEEVNEKVNTMSGKLSESVDTLSKGFVDTLLASIGVVILTLIASLAENKTQGAIFTVGMLLYAGYLLVFQVIYRIGNLFFSTNLAIKEGEKQLDPYRTALGSKKVNEMTVFLDERKRYYRVVFLVTVFLFILFILIIAISGVLLPEYVSKLMLASPTGTATAYPSITDTPINQSIFTPASYP
jgi:hypothetical protein